MGLLNQKEQVFDVVLTDRGRELLSKNKLEFAFYAFSDEGINYQNILSQSLHFSKSFDDIVRNNLYFEATQRKNKDLSSFLYTIPIGSKILPKFTISVDTSVDISLQRRYKVGNINDLSFMKESPKPIDAIMSVGVPETTQKDKEGNYLHKQLVASIFADILEKDASI